MDEFAGFYEQLNPQQRQGVGFNPSGRNTQGQQQFNPQQYETGQGNAVLANLPPKLRAAIANRDREDQARILSILSYGKLPAPSPDDILAPTPAGTPQLGSPGSWASTTGLELQRLLEAQRGDIGPQNILRDLGRYEENVLRPAGTVGLQALEHGLEQAGVPGGAPFVNKEPLADVAAYAKGQVTGEGLPTTQKQTVTPTIGPDGQLTQQVTEETIPDRVGATDIYHEQNPQPKFVRGISEAVFDPANVIPIPVIDDIARIGLKFGSQVSTQGFRRLWQQAGRGNTQARQQIKTLWQRAMQKAGESGDEPALAELRDFGEVIGMWDFPSAGGGASPVGAGPSNDLIGEGAEDQLERMIREEGADLPPSVEAEVSGQAETPAGDRVQRAQEAANRLQETQLPPHLRTGAAPAAEGQSGFGIGEQPTQSEFGIENRFDATKAPDQTQPAERIPGTEEEDAIAAAAAERERLLAAGQQDLFGDPTPPPAEAPRVTEADAPTSDTEQLPLGDTAGEAPGGMADDVAEQPIDVQTATAADLQETAIPDAMIDFDRRFQFRADVGPRLVNEENVQDLVNRWTWTPTADEAGFERPILWRDPADGRYKVVKGYHRTRAHRDLQAHPDPEKQRLYRPDVPVKVLPEGTTAEEAIEIAKRSNFEVTATSMRSDLAAIESLAAQNKTPDEIRKQGVRSLSRTRIDQLLFCPCYRRPTHCHRRAFRRPLPACLADRQAHEDGRRAEGALRPG